MCRVQSVVRKQSSLQPDGSTASSVYSSVAESPIPLLDDLLSQPAQQQPQLLSAGARGGRLPRGSPAISALASSSRSARGGGGGGGGAGYGVGDVGDEVDIPSVADELDLLSLASQPNVYIVPVSQHGRSADIDILTGTPPVEEQSLQPALPSSGGSGRPPRSKAASTAASSASSPAHSSNVRRAPISAGVAPTSSSPSSAAAAAGRRSAQSSAVSAAAGKSTAVSAKKAALLAQLAALEQEDDEANPTGRRPAVEVADSPAYGDGYDEQPEGEGQQYLTQPQPQSQRSQAGVTRSSAPQQSQLRTAAATQPRRVKQTAQQQRYHDEEEETVAGVSAEQQYDEPALLDTLQPTALPPSVSNSSKPVSQRAPNVGRKTVSQHQQPMMSDVWNRSALTDLDHLAASSSSTPAPISMRAPKGSSMAEMQSAAPFPSASSLASSMLDDEALQSAFARKAPTSGTHSLGTVGGKELSSGRRKPTAASTDIFFQR